MLMRLFLWVFLFFCAPMGVAFAQSGLSLLVDPPYPEANQSYTVSLYSSTEDIASVRWFLGGNELSEKSNEKKIRLEARGVGLSDTLTAEATTRRGDIVRASKTITPVRTDIVISADTITPPFYAGRRLGSSGSDITATAFPFFGNPTSLGKTTYLWKIGNKVQNGGVPSANNYVTFKSGFEKEILVGVSIYRDNVLVAEKSIFVPISESEVHFYEKNPLRGLSFVALKDPHLFIGEELLMRAETYFTSRDLDGSYVERQWSINGKKVEGSIEDPSELTLTKQGSGGVATVSFRLRNLQQLLQGALGEIGVQF